MRHGTWFIVALIAAAVLIAALNDRTKEWAARRAERRGQRPARRHLNSKTAWGTVVGLILASALLPSLAGRIPHAPLVTGCVVATLGVTALAATAYAAWANRIVNRANRLALAGDMEGAIALLREHLRNGANDAMIFNNLAVFHGSRGEWDDALATIEEAGARAGWKPLLLANKGLFLWKLGRPKEALTCLEEATRLEPRNLLSVCHYGAVLAEAGRLEDAADCLRQAERLFASEQSAVDRAVKEKAVEELRQRVTKSFVL